MIRVFLILLAIGMFNLTAAAQSRYPIKTLINEDSVVILSVKQFNQLNGTLLAQTKSAKKAQQTIRDLKIQALELEQKALAAHALYASDTSMHRTWAKRIADSLEIKIGQSCASAKAKLKLIDDWLLETAVGNAYVFFDWKDSTVKVMDLTLYETQIDADNGNFFFIRRGDNSQYSDFRKKLWQYPESPDKNWFTVKSPEEKPILYPYLHKIQVKNPFLGDFGKNPYSR
jgi:hypothetical protein